VRPQVGAVDGIGAEDPKRLLELLVERTEELLLG
jgi:hypothetical protein